MKYKGFEIPKNYKACYESYTTSKSSCKVYSMVSCANIQGCDKCVFYRLNNVHKEVHEAIGRMLKKIEAEDRR